MNIRSDYNMDIVNICQSSGKRKAIFSFTQIIPKYKMKKIINNFSISFFYL